MGFANVDHEGSGSQARAGVSVRYLLSCMVTIWIRVSCEGDSKIELQCYSLTWMTLISMVGSVQSDRAVLGLGFSVWVHYGADTVLGRGRFWL